MGDGLEGNGVAGGGVAGAGVAGGGVAVGAGIWARSVLASEKLVQSNRETGLFVNIVFL